MSIHDLLCPFSSGTMKSKVACLLCSWSCRTIYIYGQSYIELFINYHLSAISRHYLEKSKGQFWEFNFSRPRARFTGWKQLSRSTSSKIRTYVLQCAHVNSSVDPVTQSSLPRCVTSTNYERGQNRRLGEVHGLCTVYVVWHVFSLTSRLTESWFVFDST